MSVPGVGGVVSTLQQLMHEHAPEPGTPYCRTCSMRVEWPCVSRSLAENALKAATEDRQRKRINVRDVLILTIGIDGMERCCDRVIRAAGLEDDPGVAGAGRTTNGDTDA